MTNSIFCSTDGQSFDMLSGASPVELLFDCFLMCSSISDELENHFNSISLSTSKIEDEAFFAHGINKLQMCEL